MNSENEVKNEVSEVSEVKNEVSEVTEVRWEPMVFSVWKTYKK